MTYYGTDPSARRAFLAANNIVRRDDDQYYRSHPDVPLPGSYPASSEADEIAWMWRSGDPSRVIRQETIDVAASGPENGLVRRTQTINLDCGWCHVGQSLLPAPNAGPDPVWICGPCADDSYHARAAEEAEADLRLRSAIRDLAEVLPGYAIPPALPRWVRTRCTGRGSGSQSAEYGVRNNATPREGGHRP